MVLQAPHVPAPKVSIARASPDRPAGA